MKKIIDKLPNYEIPLYQFNVVRQTLSTSLILHTLRVSYPYFLVTIDKFLNPWNDNTPLNSPLERMHKRLFR